MEFIHTLTTFYNLPISLVVFAHWLIDVSEYAQFGLIVHWISLQKSTFLKNGYLENFVNITKDLGITYT